MLRELSTLLDELHDGLNGIQAHHGVRLANVDMTLPLDLRPVFRNGGCVLLADVPRSSGIDAWIASPSKLTIGWSADAHVGFRSPGGAEGDTRDLSGDTGPGSRSAPPGLRDGDAEATP